MTNEVEIKTEKFGIIKAKKKMKRDYRSQMLNSYIWIEDSQGRVITKLIAQEFDLKINKTGFIKFGPSYGHDYLVTIIEIVKKTNI